MLLDESFKAGAEQYDSLRIKYFRDKSVLDVIVFHCRNNLRAAGSPESSGSSRLSRQGGRGQSLPSSVARGAAHGARALSTGSTPRSSQSPETKRSTITFGEYVANR